MHHSRAGRRHGAGPMKDFAKTPALLLASLICASSCTLTSGGRPSCESRRHHHQSSSSLLLALIGLIVGRFRANSHQSRPDGHLFSATAAQFQGADRLIHRAPLRTEQFNVKQLNLPHFVSSFRYGEHVYFLFREVASEHLNCGKTIYSRIARVCANDAGGSSTRNREHFSSFVKARLNCSIPGDFPFYFDEIQASTHVVQSAYLQAGRQSGQPTTLPPSGQQTTASNLNQDLIYAVFTTPTNSIGGSAVCAFRMADVLAAFEGPFKSQADSNSNWLPVPEARVPQPRPGSCAQDRAKLPEETINFVRDNPLMDTTIGPIWAQPLVTMASINFRFTQIAVDPQVATPQVFGASSLRTDVIFVATDDGRVLKLMNSYHLMASNQVNKVLLAASPQHFSLQQQLQPAASALSISRSPPLAQVLVGPSRQYPEMLPDVSANTVIIEELHLFDQRTPITALLLHRPASADFVQQHNGGAKLIVMSSRQIKAVPLSRCERALSCTDCLALNDPYCIWDLQQGACLSTGRSEVIGARAMQFAPSPTPSTATSNQPHQLTMNPYQQQQLLLSSLANNHSLAWWSSASFCPAHPIDQQQLPIFPYKSMFASHLQVPSRFDYSSGHHLSRTSLVALPQITQISSTPPQPLSPASSQTRPVSECLSLCGGVYSPPVAMSQPTATSDSNILQPPYLSCADYFASAPNSLLIQQQNAGSNGQNIQPQQLQNLYTSENLKWAVIICALIGLSLGLAFGFAIGKNSRSKNESSICSSTFDETNLYMASTGSHNCHMTANGLFAPLSNHHHHHHLNQPNSTVARLTNHPAFIATQAANSNNGSGMLMASNNNYSPNGPLLDGGGNSQQGRQQSAALFEATQSLLGVSSDHSSGIGSSTYANQQHQHQQLLYHNKTNHHERAPSVRTGALPPIPNQHLPMVMASQGQTTHHSQLTPNSSTGGSQKTSSNGGSVGSNQSTGSQSTLQQQSDQQSQFYHQLTNTNQTTGNNLHQRSFTNSSAASGNVKQAPGSNSTFLQSAQQQQLQPNNKIFL